MPGTLVGLAEDRLDEALGVLDAVEATATDVLARVVVTTVDGVAAWAYDCARPEPAWTPSPCGPASTNADRRGSG